MLSFTLHSSNSSITQNALQRQNIWIKQNYFKPAWPAILIIFLFDAKNQFSFSGMNLGFQVSLITDTEETVSGHHWTDTQPVREMNRCSSMSHWIKSAPVLLQSLRYILYRWKLQREGDQTNLIRENLNEGNGYCWPGPRPRTISKRCGFSTPQMKLGDRLGAVEEGSNVRLFNAD